jgi:hypothetical protein
VTGHPRTAGAGQVPEIPTSFAGANRIRFEGLRFPALSALARSPVVCTFDTTRLGPCGKVGVGGCARDTDARKKVSMGTIVWRIIGTGGPILAGVVASKIVTTVWTKAGRDATIDPRDPRTPVGEALAFAAFMGVAVGLARVMATRKAAEYYERSAGHLPKPMQHGEV